MTMSEGVGELSPAAASPTPGDSRPTLHEHWDINDAKLPIVSSYDGWQEWPEGHCRYVYAAQQEEARRHTSGWAMRNTNNHNVNILKKSCLGVLVCKKRCTLDNGHNVHIRPAICDKARKKQLGKPCPNPRCDGSLELQPCRGHSGFPVTHFWRQSNGAIYFQAKGHHDHPKPEVKASAQARRSVFGHEHSFLYTPARGRQARKRSSMYGSIDGSTGKIQRLQPTGNEVLCSCPPFECFCATKQQQPPYLTISGEGDQHDVTAYDAHAHALQVSPSGGDMYTSPPGNFHSTQSFYSAGNGIYSRAHMTSCEISPEYSCQQSVHSSWAAANNLAVLAPTVQVSSVQTSCSSTISPISVESQSIPYDSVPKISATHAAEYANKEKGSWDNYNNHDWINELEFKHVAEFLSLDQPIDKSREFARPLMELSPESPRKYGEDANKSTTSPLCASYTATPASFSQSLGASPEWYSRDVKPTLLVDVNCNDFSELQSQSMAPTTSSPVLAELKPLRDVETHAKWPMQATPSAHALADGTPGQYTSKPEATKTLPSILVEKSAFLPYGPDSYPGKTSDGLYDTNSHEIGTDLNQSTQGVSPDPQDAWCAPRRCISVTFSYK